MPLIINICRVAFLLSLALSKKNPCSTNNTFRQREVSLNKTYHSIDAQNFKMSQIINV